MTLKPPTFTNIPDSGTGGTSGSGNARVLLWDLDLEEYAPAEFQTDTSVPREFVGPTDPSTIPAITGPVYGDRWTPTEEPVT